MVRRTYFVELDQDEFIKNLPGKKSDHLRLALAEYIQKKKKQPVSASISPSQPIRNSAMIIPGGSQ